MKLGTHTVVEVLGPLRLEDHDPFVFWRMKCRISSYGVERVCDVYAYSLKEAQMIQVGYRYEA